MSAPKSHPLNCIGSMRIKSSLFQQRSPGFLGLYRQINMGPDTEIRLYKLRSDYERDKGLKREHVKHTIGILGSFM